LRLFDKHSWSNISQIFNAAICKNNAIGWSNEPIREVEDEGLMSALIGAGLRARCADWRGGSRAQHARTTRAQVKSCFKTQTRMHACLSIQVGWNNNGETLRAC